MKATIFCLGCGELTHDVAVPDSASVSGVALPGWCGKPPCEKKREKFDEAVERARAFLRERGEGVSW